ncbi:PepSY domain-containing protein [Methylorubrum aminovorans]|nr:MULTISPECIES: PepSY domain-containing protein [unclassified Methylobacterium]QIJ73596.1 PepSY domain-containing protein [Methylobacterium sp. CLZ]QIJ78505.1 PepSY domain-containing protein [Methylobacterium sp. NI91]
MNTRKTALAATLIAGLAAAPALADTPGKDWMPIDQVLTKLTEAGYGSVRSIEADDGVWKAKASRDGRDVKVRLDPQTGAIVEKAGKASDD